jgi:putative oxidoreductase
MDLTLVAALSALGQLLLGGLFVYAGLHHFVVAPTIVQMIAARGVPLPKATLYAGSIFQIVAGACLMLGVYVAPAALGLVLFTIVATVMLLNFWDMEGAAREAMQNAAMQNAAIAGGLLIAAAQSL